MKVSRVSINGNRYYRVGTQLFPSVTTVLSVISKKFVSRWETGLALTKFRQRLDERIQSGTADSINLRDLESWTEEAHAEPAVVLGVAGGFGTQAHSLIEDLLTPERADSVVVPPEYETVVGNFTDWRASIPNMEFLHNEMVVYSERNKFAGSVDAVARIGNEIVIMDWKTSNKIYSEYSLQVAAYAAAYEEMTGQKVSQGWVVRFDKKVRKPPQVKMVGDLRDSYETFMAAKRLWTYLNATSKTT